MNSVYILKMRPWVYLIEIPLMMLLAMCWSINGHVEGLLKLYPLIIVLAFGIVFLAVYFFRLCEVSWEEIKDVGLFSGRDSALINKGKTLNIKLLSRGRIKLTLIGTDGEYAGFDWLKPEDGEPSDIALYRANAYGGKGSAKRLLKYFGVCDEDVEAILSDAEFSAEYDYCTVEAETTDEAREINVKITETLTADGTPIGKKAED